MHMDACTRPAGIIIYYYLWEQESIAFMGAITPVNDRALPDPDPPPPLPNCMHTHTRYFYKF